MIFSGKLGTLTWLGAYNFYGEWCWDGFHTGQFTVTDWMSNEPNNAGGNENCVEIYTNGKWNELVELVQNKPVPSQLLGNVYCLYFDWLEKASLNHTLGRSNTSTK